MIDRTDKNSRKDGLQIYAIVTTKESYRKIPTPIITLLSPTFQKIFFNFSKNQLYLPPC